MAVVIHVVELDRTLDGVANMHALLNLIHV